MNRKLPVPAVVPFISLDAPGDDVWHWGDPASPEFVRGSALDFCLLVTQRRNLADTGLRYSQRLGPRVAVDRAVLRRAAGRCTRSGRAQGGPRVCMSGLPLTLALREPIEEALTRLREGSAEQCLSDHAFSNLYLFREAHDYRYLPGDWPCISGRAYDGVRHLMPLFALQDAPLDVLRGLLEGHDCLYPIAQRHAEGLSPSQFRQWSSADDADYLFAASQFTDYPGRALARKRNQVRQLLATCVPRSVSFGVEAAEAARQVLRGWMAQKGKAPGEADESACLEAIARRRPSASKASSISRTTSRWASCWRRSFSRVFS